MTERSDPEPGRSLTELFEAARSLPLAERSAFLERECGDDETRRQVEQWLAAETVVDESLPDAPQPGDPRLQPRGTRLADAGPPTVTERPVAADTRAANVEGAQPTDDGGFARKTEEVPARDANQPRTIGPFRVLGVLGEGGMGTVYLAQQEKPIQRRVAVKVIQPTRAKPSLRHRFEAERQALARMSHPAIAQVYQAGDTDDGQPYIAMELVDGEPIDDYCDRNRLTLEQRFELFVTVCQGIQHAHQKGVLHRDIKPSNILVAEDDGRPMAKIIDFGIAKALDQPLVDHTLTAHGMVGTPAYLSPESIRGGAEADTRSDVYALGILLYQLIVGVIPFNREETDVLGLAQDIIDGRPAPPSTRLAGLGTETMEIVAKARRTTPAVLSRKLRGDLRWITLRAIDAELTRRYPSAAALADDVERHLKGLPVNAGPPSRVYQVRKFVARHRTAVAAAALVLLALVAGITARTLEAQRANRAADEARQANRETEQVVDFLIELFEVSDPGQSRGETITAQELLDRGAQKIGEGLGDQPLTQARLTDTIGVVYHKLGLYEQADEALGQALAMRRDELGSAHPTVADSLNHLGHLRWVQGRYDEAEESFRDALEIRRATDGAESLAVAEVLDNLGSLYDVRGDFEEAQPLFEQALAIREGSLGPNHPEVASSLDDLAVLAIDAHRPADAEPLFQRALEIREAAFGTDHPDVAQTLNGLALAAAHQDRSDEAIAHHRRALEIRERVLGPEHPDLGQSLYNLGNELLYGGDPEAGAPLLERALSVWEASLGESHPRTARVVFSLAELRVRLGQQAEAERMYRRVAAIFEETLGTTHSHLGVVNKALGDLVRGQERLDEAEQLYRRALDIQEAALPEGSPPRVTAAESLAELLREAGRDEEADAALARGGGSSDDGSGDDG